MNLDVSRDTKTIPHDLIDVDPEQPRRYFDPVAINELATSIEANGLAVPILVRIVGDRYTLVHGERRLRAMTLLGWTQIPVEVRELDADAARWLQLVENVNREDLTPVEEAQAYRNAMSRGITQQQLADRIGKSRTQVAQKVRLLDLPAAALELITHGRISEGHARQLLKIKALYTADHIAEVDRDACQHVADELAAKDWHSYIHVVIQLRPLDWPPGFPIPPDDPVDVRAASKFFEALANGSIPQWHITAMYYAFAASKLAVSVSTLSDWVSNWIEQIESAIVCLATSDRLPDSFFHLGYKSDLRHAGLASHDHISGSDLIHRLPNWNPLVPSFYGLGPGRGRNWLAQGRGGR